MIVCLCTGVSDRVVTEVIAAGAKSVDAIRKACAAGQGCGACEGSLQELLKRHRESAGGARAGASVPLALESVGSDR